MYVLFVQQVKAGDIGECPQAVEVVGAAAKQLESGQSGVIDTKHDIRRILAQHSYAHPYPIDTPQIKEENGDKGDLFYASYEANDCVTIEVPSEDQVVGETLPVTNVDELSSNVDASSIKVDASAIKVDESSIKVDVPSIVVDQFKSEFDELTNNHLDVTLECDMKLLSPMSLEDNLLELSPAHTSFSDLGYESLSSPLSENESMDLSDFWCESFSELFPGLA